MKVILLLSPSCTSPGGEIGRRTVFRSQHSQGCAGSNPVPGTSKKVTSKELPFLIGYLKNE